MMNQTLAGKPWVALELLCLLLGCPFAVHADPHPDALPNSHAPGEVDVPANVKYIVSDPGTLDGIVLDETQATLEGKWQYSTHTPPYVGIGYLHDRKAEKGRKSVTWLVDLPESGKWEVRISHCYNKRRATNTPVTVFFPGGSKTVRINQQSVPPHGRLFRSLGVFRFEQGEPAKVVISNEGTDTSKVVIADAIQFLKVE